MSEVEKSQKNAWRIYKSLMKQKYFCNALHKYVRFSNQGWRHLSNHARPTKRTTSDLLHRFSLLEKAVPIITTTKKVATHTLHNKTFYTLQEKIGERIIRVVLVEDTAGNVIFLSVIDKT